MKKRAYAGKIVVWFMHGLILLNIDLRAKNESACGLQKQATCCSAILDKKSNLLSEKSHNLTDQDQGTMDTKSLKHHPVQKKVLKNGLTVLVRSMHNIPKVSLQIWYNVGSKDEKSGERGIAHLIEHMIFKGTDKLSESDINVVAHKLSGSINAFTSYDYTGYLFNFPTQHWHEALPIMADCMQNAAFKDEHLNSEMKAVIQELKMYRDDYHMSLIEELISSIFPDHPYHYPIIGFKQDLWSVKGADLKAFYKKHYAPNNATLVVVGDVDAQEVFKVAEQYFGAIPANPGYKKETFHFNQDIGCKAVTIYRDVQQPMVALVFVAPGVTDRKEHVLEAASWILGSGKSSRLYKKIVDELKLATSLSTSYWDLFDHSLFFILFEPNKIEDAQKIQDLIQQEIDDIIKNGVNAQEVERALKKAQMKLYSVLENSERQAYDIGKYYLSTGDENYIYNYLDVDPIQLGKEVQQLFATYFRSALMHKGLVLPLPVSEKPYAAILQDLSDKEDERILSVRQRASKVEEPVYANDIVAKDPGVFDFPKSATLTLDNGLKVLYYNNQNDIPKINVVLEFKARPFYDSTKLPGLYNFVMSMISEGTKKYNASQLAHEIESRGMSLNAGPGSISMSMLSKDLEKGLELLEEVVTNAVFNKDEIEKVRTQILADIKNFWDEPSSFAGQLVREQIYQGHPYSKNLLGTAESINKITQDDLIEFYKSYISPVNAKMAVVGDLSAYNLKDVLQKTIAQWQGSQVKNIEFPDLRACGSKQVNHPINRDQIVLCYAGLSVDRKHQDYDKLLLFDQIFGSGALGSLHSRLFRLREQSGLFYTINGSLIANSDDQPGMLLIKTIVSLDRLTEAEKAITDTVATVIDTITEPEFVEARHAVENSLMNNFESNSSIARAFLFLDRFGFASDYFDKRAEQLKKVDLASMQAAAKKVMNDQGLLTLRIGRVPEKKA